MSFHIVFPAITIGLASYLAVLEALWLRTGRAVYPRPLPVLVEDLRRQLRHGRRLGARDGLPVRHQLERLLALRRQRHRAAARLRGADRVLPRGRLPRRDAVRLEPRRARAALLRDADGRGRHADLGDVDPRVEQLDAHAAGLRDRRRPRRADRLARGDLQSVVPVPAHAHGRRRRTSRPRWSSARPARGTCCAAATTRRSAR